MAERSVLSYLNSDNRTGSFTGLYGSLTGNTRSTQVNLSTPIATPPGIEP